MATKPVIVGDLIHRVASSCLSNRLPCNYTLRDSIDSNLDDDDDNPFADAIFSSEKCWRSPPAAEVEEIKEEEGEEEEEEEKLKIWEDGEQEQERLATAAKGVERTRDANALMAEGAHCPWDPDKMRATDAAVVAELRHLARLRDRFRRSAAAGHIPCPNPSAPPLHEVVAPYEAALDDLQRQLQPKQAKVDGLKKKLAVATSRRNGRHHHHPLSKQNGPDGGAVHLLCRAGPRGDAGVCRAPRAPDARRGAGARGGHSIAHQDPGVLPAAGQARAGHHTRPPRRLSARVLLPGRLPLVAAGPRRVPARGRARKG
ncbi:unnamed protein product [Miscanthus lutarioriparius]|uniref:DUF641 domain-containing protein n=1 Tax=Miscanthus lutarioriparius TaxID=422564 RepID=A0A811RR75_9POAL|nr:unnamed protein product [Miscanthus lutarioriparius]